MLQLRVLSYRLQPFQSVIPVACGFRELHWLKYNVRYVARYPVYQQDILFDLSVCPTLGLFAPLTYGNELV